MSRVRIVIPLLLSSLVVPAFGETSHCLSAGDARPDCAAERAREFAAARNAEIEASIAAGKAARSLDLARTYCKSPSSTTPRCAAERAREFAAARNAEIDASIAAANAERSRVLAAVANAEFDASIAAINAERARAFAAARNAEIEASIATVAFVRKRNAEINRSIATVNVVRRREFAAARNAEINASIAAVKAARARAFAAARNAEINRSLVAYRVQRTLRVAIAQRNSGFGLAGKAAHIDTGAIPMSDAPATAPRARAKRYASLYSSFCREAGRPLNPLQFAKSSAEIEDHMKPTLNRLVALAKACPTVSFEIHGHSDTTGPVQVSRSVADHRAQAIVGYLVAAGVEPKRLAAIGHAAREPLVPRASAENRRVEVEIHDPAMRSAVARVIWDLAELLDPTYVPVVARLSP